MLIDLIFFIKRGDMLSKVKNLKNLALLYVEDEDDTRKNLTNVFKNLFKSVYTASNGVDGLEIFKNNDNEIKVVITDLHMPFMDGIEMVKNIKDIKKDIKIIVTTSFPDEIDEGSENINEILVKPVLTTNLLKALEE